MATNIVPSHTIEITFYHVVDGHKGIYQFSKDSRQSMNKFITKSIEHVQARSGIEDFTDYNFIMKIRKV